MEIKINAEDEDVSVMRSRADSPKLLEDDSSPLLGGKLSQQSYIDRMLERAGTGFFHVVLTLVAGISLASDSVEVQCISFVTPELYNDKEAMHPGSGLASGLLDSIIFLGMMVGGYVWGSWSDIVGRRSCLVTSLLVNGVFGLVSALSPSFSWFLAFRFFSGVGVGGSLPITFSYYCEFFSTSRRGPLVIVLAAFWIVGQVYTTLVALAVLAPLHGETLATLGSVDLKPWRVFVMLCALPCLLGSIAILFLPESPSFLYIKQKYRRLVKALNTIQFLNRLFSKKPQFSFVVNTFAEENVHTHDNKSFSAKISVIFKATCDLFGRKYVRASLVMIFIWFTLSFGYYGLLLWFPQYFQCLHESLHECSFNHSVCDTQYNATCDQTNNVYLDSVYTALASIPGTILAVVFVKYLGARIILIGSMLVSALSTFMIWFLPNKKEVVIVALSCIFNGVSIGGWNALDVLSTSELFPVQLRSTAFGIQAVVGRCGAILGNLLFGQLISQGPYLPILMVASLLLVGALSSVFLPSPSPSSHDVGLGRLLRCWRRGRGRGLCCPRACCASLCCRWCLKAGGLGESRSQTPTTPDKTN